MKLIDFLNKHPNVELFNFQQNYIDLLKIENLFKQLEYENPNKIIYLPLNSNTSQCTYLQDKINNIIDNSASNINTSNTSNTNNFIILSTNPDCDFPAPKNEIIAYQDKVFNIEQQSLLDNMNYIDKIDMNVIDQLPIQIKHVFCHAVGFANSRITMIPLGRDFKNRHLFHIIDNSSRIDRNILCYYNCTLPPQVLHWYGMIRSNIYQMIKRNNMNFIDIEYCNMHPRIYNDTITLNYYKKILASKFMICPRGCGIDTYRMWDCIYLGCIPIVEKYEGYKEYHDLPILFINHWSEIGNMTSNFLEYKWQEMLNIDYNYDKLSLTYWENIIRSKNMKK
jgi:hypothetical protein